MKIKRNACCEDKTRDFIGNLLSFKPTLKRVPLKGQHCAVFRAQKIAVSRVTACTIVRNMVFWWNCDSRLHAAVMGSGSPLGKWRSQHVWGGTRPRTKTAVELLTSKHAASGYPQKLRLLLAGRRADKDLPTTSLACWRTNKQLLCAGSNSELQNKSPTITLRITQCLTNGCGSKNRYQNGTLVSGHMDQHPRITPPV